MNRQEYESCVTDIIKVTCELLKTEPPRIKFTSRIDEFWYHDGEAYVGPCEDPESWFYASVHEACHHAFGRDVHDTSEPHSQKSIAFNYRVGDTYYDVLEKMSEELYVRVFGHPRTLAGITEAKEEWIQHKQEAGDETV